MYEFWTISPVNMMYIRLQKYTSMMVDEHLIQISESVIVLLLFLLLSFDVLVLTRAHFLLILDEWFVQIYVNVRYVY